MQKLETTCCIASEHYTEVLQEVNALELKMVIECQWDVFDAQFIHALKNLQHLVVLRLFELHKLNLSRTGGFIPVLSLTYSHMVLQVTKWELI